MKANDMVISEVLSQGRQLRIPFFQRTYVWDEPLWERFLESMNKASAPRKKYFLGTIILKQTPTCSSDTFGDVRTVIDGQQRLTTLLLFLKILSTRTGHIDEFKHLSEGRGQMLLCHNFFDRECYESILKQEELDKVNYGTQLAKAYNYFLDKIDVRDYDYYRILDNIVFVGIDLLQDENEQVIFDTINSLGVSLTTGELLKNYIFTEETVDKYETIWKPVFEKDEETINFWSQKTTLGRLQRPSLETFLSAYLNIKVNSPGIDISASEKEKFRSAEDLFNKYKSYLQLSRVDVIEFAEDLTLYAKLYRRNISSDVLKQSIQREWGVERLNVIIFGLETTTMIPYVLYILKNQSDEEEIKGISKILEAYIMRRLICKARNDNYSDLFSSNLISNRVLTKSGLMEFLSGKNEESSLAMPDDNSLLYAFNENALTNKRAKGVLYMLESLVRSENQSTALLSFNTYSLEHLLPVKWDERAWPLADGFDREERDRRLKTLGNLAILPLSTNSKIGNKSWAYKKSCSNGLVRLASGIETLYDWLSKPSWDESCINERAFWLYKKAKNIWSFDQDHYRHEEFSSAIEGRNQLSDSIVPAQRLSVHTKSEATRIRIVFNGEKIERINAIDSLEQFVRVLGVTRVYSLGIKVWNKYDLLSKTLINRRLQNPIADQYYLFKNTNSETKKKTILEIAEKLHLDNVEVDIVPKSEPILP